MDEHRNFFSMARTIRLAYRAGAWVKYTTVRGQCLVHGKESTLPRQQNVRVAFLPKNTTYILQPLDLGGIAGVKSRYKHRTIQRAVDLIDGGYNVDPYRIDLRLAAMCIYEIWDQMQKSHIFYSKFPFHWLCKP